MVCKTRIQWQGIHVRNLSGCIKGKRKGLAEWTSLQNHEITFSYRGKKSVKFHLCYYCVILVPTLYFICTHDISKTKAMKIFLKADNGVVLAKCRDSLVHQ